MCGGLKRNLFSSEMVGRRYPSHLTHSDTLGMIGWHQLKIFWDELPCSITIALLFHLSSVRMLECLPIFGFASTSTRLAVNSYTSILCHHSFIMLNQNEFFGQTPSLERYYVPTNWHMLVYYLLALCFIFLLNEGRQVASVFFTPYHMVIMKSFCFFAISV